MVSIYIAIFVYSEALVNKHVFRFFFYIYFVVQSFVPSFQAKLFELFYYCVRALITFVNPKRLLATLYLCSLPISKRSAVFFSFILFFIIHTKQKAMRRQTDIVNASVWRCSNARYVRIYERQYVLHINAIDINRGIVKQIANVSFFSHLSFYFVSRCFRPLFPIKYTQTFSFRFITADKLNIPNVKCFSINVFIHWKRIRMEKERKIDEKKERFKRNWIVCDE